MDYLIKSSGIIALFFLFYYIVLKRETFFISIRIYFLIGVILSLIIPLVEIPIYVEEIKTSISNQNFIFTASEPTEVSSKFDWIQLIMVSYLVGLLFFVIKFLVQLISLFILIKNHKIDKQDRYRIIETAQNLSPFSFFNFIVYNKNNFSEEELEQILYHEKVHVAQFHTIDTILVHILVIIFWFNPFVWLYKKSVQQNLEFLADEQAKYQSNNNKLYQLTLLKVSKVGYYTAITNHFNHSLIKKRIIMLNQIKSKTANQWKYALIIPLLIVFIATFNTKAIAQEKNISNVEKVMQIKIALVIDKKTTDETFKRKSELFKKEFNIDLSFSKVQRNKDKEITGIKIEAKGTDVAALFHNSASNTIQPILISYNSKSNTIAIGNYQTTEANNMHKKHMKMMIHENEIGENNENVFYFSDDNNTKWIYKKKLDSIKINEEITVMSDEKKWNSKDGKEKKFIVISSDSDEVQHIEVEGDKDKNIFIVKRNGDAHTKVIKKHEGDMMFFSSNHKNALMFIDDIETTENEVEKLDHKKIEKVEVLKGDKAVSKYGDKAKDGVVLITTKKE